MGGNALCETSPVFTKSRLNCTNSRRRVRYSLQHTAKYNLPGYLKEVLSVELVVIFPYSHMNPSFLLFDK